MAWLAGLLASELEEQAIFQEYQRNEDELMFAVRGRNATRLSVLAKAVPYRTLAAAASRELGVEDSSCSEFRQALSCWDPAARARWGEAAARDQWRWLRTQDRSLLVDGSPPREPGRHWSNMCRLPRIRLRCCYQCHQMFVVRRAGRGLWSGVWRHTRRHSRAHCGKGKEWTFSCMSSCVAGHS